MAEKLCLNCGESIKGRADKKFCDDHCRSNYNYNRSGRDHLNFVRNVNRILRKNRAILKDLNRDGRTIVRRKSLNKMGFNFSYHTSILETARYSRYYFCYEIGYVMLNDYEILLISNESIG